MNRCINCEYWKKRYNERNYGDCNCDKMIENPNKLEDDEVGYSDYEGYSAFFETGQNFGCIHFKQKKYI